MEPTKDPNALPMPDFIPPPDLTNPDVLARELNSFAAGLLKEAQAHTTQGAVSGHCNPAFFFSQCAARMQAAATMIKGKSSGFVQTPATDLQRSDADGGGLAGGTHPGPDGGQPAAPTPAAQPSAGASGGKKEKAK